MFHTRRKKSGTLVEGGGCSTPCLVLVLHSIESICSSDFLPFINPRNHLSFLSHQLAFWHPKRIDDPHDGFSRFESAKGFSCAKML